MLKNINRTIDEIADNICRKWHVQQDTEVHMKRVAELIPRVAAKMAISKDEIVRLVAAARLHDVGKTLIPLEILNKPGKLSEDEFRTMKKHVELGVAILEVEKIDPEVVRYVVKHHERKNGCGYPNNIRDITIEDEILSMCDMFDALVSDRPYRDAKSTADAWNIINEHNFDRQLLQIFYEIVVMEYVSYEKDLVWRRMSL